MIHSFIFIIKVLNISGMLGHPTVSSFGWCTVMSVGTTLTSHHPMLEQLGHLPSQVSGCGESHSVEKLGHHAPTVFKALFPMLLMPFFSKKEEKNINWHFC